MSVSESDKKSLREELEENVDVFSEEFEKALHINDFILVEKAKPKIIQDKDDQDNRKQLEIINSSVATVAPYESFRESSGDTVLSQNKYSDEKKTADGEAVVTSDSEKELLVEQKYWEQNRSAAKKMNKLKSKCLTSQRMTLKEHNIIDNAKVTTRHPSSYQFDIATTDILEMFLKKQNVGRYLNVAGRGLNSVVIYSPNSETEWRRYGCGVAVKVYKLGSDVRKNSTILKKAQREYDNLKTLYFYSFVPHVNYIFKNVTVMEFIGFNQETAPSINSLPLEKSKEMYDMMVKQLHDWYKLHIVHGKLSSKYIRLLWDKPYVLGWSHSVGTEHPRALKKLIRDCHFVTEFFKRRGVPVASTEELFRSISGVDKLSRTLLDVIYGKNLWQDHHQTNPNRTSDGHCSPHSTSRFKA